MAEKIWILDLAEIGSMLASVVDDHFLFLLLLA